MLSKSVKGEFYRSKMDDMPRIYAMIALIICLQCSASAAEKIRIEIDSSWGGLGEPSKSNLIIHGDNGRFSADGKRIKPELVDELLRAVDAPSISAPELGNCGTTPEWLQSNFVPALEEHERQKLSEFSKDQIDLFREHFTQPSFAQQALERHFNSGWHTDDFPKITVRILRSGRELLLSSSSQHHLMLPWGIHSSSGEVQTYNCEVSSALMKLLPSKFTNRSRLDWRGLRYYLAEQVMRSIEPEWNALDTEAKIGTEIRPITERYKLKKTAISCLASIDLDKCGWNAELVSPSLPSGMVIGIGLPFDHNKLIGVEAFLSRADYFSNLVRSVPWLAEWEREYPATKIELRFVRDRSLSTKALQSVIEDLKKHGNSLLANRINAEANEIAFVEIETTQSCWSRWLVFPNREVLLWHFHCDPVLRWSASEFKSWDYFGWRAVGAVISPEGKVIH
ncbi:MAG: hypothetical protein JWO13_3137 [Acidobacteriales bacterium]|nr:hypothetical protein [Terriglobales bacterium]